MKRAIILSQGRSGSTLVQRVMNTVDKAYIAGENNNFWYHQFKAWESWCYVPIWEEKLSSGKPYSYNSTNDNYKPCWWNKDYDSKKEGLLNTQRNMFSDLYEKGSICGFKEIRFPTDTNEFNAYLDWWRMMFPDIYFIFTVRNIKTIHRSGWWTRQDIPLLKQQESLLRSRDDAFLMEYESFDWKGLFRYIGEEYDQNEVNRILNKKL